jgi:hypothetical protein
MYGAAVNPRERSHLATAVLWLILFAVIAVSSTACQSVAPVVKVGLVAPFEGRHRPVGYDVLYSARLAVRELNAAGGINGTRVSLIALDDSGNPEFAADTADSLIVDPAVVAVVGHWLPETTAVAAPRYDHDGLAFIAGGEVPFHSTDPAQLSPDFVASYNAVTPFDETPGPYAGPAYDAYQSLWRLLELAQDQHGAITRATVIQTLKEID